ncbi:MAG: lysophospholipid acyltransferase family protein, partial [Actinomycetota bacterium]
LRRGELFGIFPEGTRSRDGMLYKGRTGAARLALAVGCPIFPVGITGTREIQPPDAVVPKVNFPRFNMRCSIRIGQPIDVSRYADREADHMVLREITDELMFEIRELTGQEYRNTYASKGGTVIASENSESPVAVSP